MFRLQRQFEQKKRDVQAALDNVNTEKTALLRANAKDKAKLDQLEAYIAQQTAEVRVCVCACVCIYSVLCVAMHHTSR